MTRDDWNQVLASEPATGAQVGAIIAEFARLGVDDRAERLAITAGLLGLEHHGSTTDLVMGDAGRLVGMLRRTHDRAELPDVAAAAGDEDQADEPDEDQAGEPDEDQAGAERITLAGAILRIMVMIYAASSGQGTMGKPADIGLNTASANPARPREDDISQ